ncbi:MAG: hypothetical protein ACLS6O_09595 [Bifidobacterium sp.]
MLLGVGDLIRRISTGVPVGNACRELAQALRQRGITSVTLKYDDSCSVMTVGGGIAELDSNHVYYAPTASMAVDGGRKWNGAGPQIPISSAHIQL